MPRIEGLAGDADALDAQLPGDAGGEGGAQAAAGARLQIAGIELQPRRYRITEVLGGVVGGELQEPALRPVRRAAVAQPVAEEIERQAAHCQAVGGALDRARQGNALVVEAAIAQFHRRLPRNLLPWTGGPHVGMHVAAERELAQPRQRHAAQLRGRVHPAPGQLQGRRVAFAVVGIGHRKLRLDRVGAGGEHDAAAPAQLRESIAHQHRLQFDDARFRLHSGLELQVGLVRQRQPVQRDRVAAQRPVVRPGEPSPEGKGRFERSRGKRQWYRQPDRGTAHGERARVVFGGEIQFMAAGGGKSASRRMGQAHLVGNVVDR